MKMTNRFLVLAEPIEGGEWIAIMRLFTALKKDSPEILFFLIAFVTKFMPDLTLFEEVKMLRHSKIKGSLNYIKNSVADFLNIRKNIKRCIDLYDVNFVLTLDFISALAAISLGRSNYKVVFLFHGMRSVPFYKISDVNYWQIIIKFLEHLSWVLADAVFVPSKKGIDYILKYIKFLPGKRSIFLIPNIVTPDFFMAPSGSETSKLIEEIGIINVKRIILYSGRLGAYKGLGKLIPGFAKFHLENPDTILLVAYPHSSAEPDVLRMIKSLIGEHNLSSKVKFIGSPTKKKLIKIYHLAHVLVLPSELETAPLVVLESFAAGLPVIATKIGNNLDLIKRVDSKLILEDNSVNEIYKKLTVFFDLPTKRLNKLKEKSKEIAKEYSAETSVKTFQKSIQKL